MIVFLKPHNNQSILLDTFLDKTSFKCNKTPDYSFVISALLSGLINGKNGIMFRHFTLYKHNPVLCVVTVMILIAKACFHNLIVSKGPKAKGPLYLHAFIFTRYCNHCYPNKLSTAKHICQHKNL